MKKADEADRAAQQALLNGLRQGRSVSFRVRGVSMGPWIRDGDTVEVQPERVVRIGDVVLLRDGEMLRVHRVVRVRAGEVRTAGDRFSAPDRPVPESAVVGRVFAVRRMGRMVRWPLWRPFSFAWAALFPARRIAFPILRMVRSLVQAQNP